MLESLFTYKQKQYPGISNSFEMLQGICKFFLPLFPMCVLDSLQTLYDRIRFSFENSSSNFQNLTLIVTLQIHMNS